MAINILVSQPQSLEIYKTITEEYGSNISFEFKPFIKIKGVSCNDIRKMDIDYGDHTGVIMTSKHSVDNYFRISKEIKFKVPNEMKFFCQTEQVAHYLKKYILYRKRKISFGKKTFDDLIEVIKEKGLDDKIMFPTSNFFNDKFAQKLNDIKVNWKRITLYKTVNANLKKLDINKYNVILFFTPFGIKSFLESFPNFKQGDTKIGIFGESTKREAESNGLYVNINAPTKKHPSMVMALKEEIEKENLKVIF